MTPPTITGITTTIIAIPRVARLTLSGGSRNDATTVLVELSTDAGLTGIGQTLVDPPAFGAAGIKADIDAYLAPLLIGQSPFDIARLHTVMEQTLPGHRAAHAGIDLALWDLKGKALGVPVYELLGGRVRDGITLMAMVRHGEPESMARETDELLRTPYPALKMKIGMGVAADIARYHAVREAAGDRAAIQVDGNGGYSLGQAMAALAAMERIGGLGMIEQPVARMNDLAALSAHFTAPVMADESFDGPDALIEIAKRGAAQAAFLKSPKQGGLLGALTAAHIAGAAGIDLSIAVYSDVLAAAAAHLAAALPAITWPSFVARLADSVLTEPLTPSGTSPVRSAGSWAGRDIGPGKGALLHCGAIRETHPQYVYFTVLSMFYGNYVFSLPLSSLLFSCATMCAGRSFAFISRWWHRSSWLHYGNRQCVWQQGDLGRRAPCQFTIDGQDDLIRSSPHGCAARYGG